MAHPGLAKIPLPEPPKTEDITGYATVKEGGSWAAPTGGGLCFDAKGFKLLRARDELKDYYTNTLRKFIEDHNKRIDQWFKDRGLR